MLWRNHAILHLSFHLSSCCQTVLEDFVTSSYQIQWQLNASNISVGCNYLDHCLWDARSHMTTEIAGYWTTQPLVTRDLILILSRLQWVWNELKCRIEDLEITTLLLIWGELKLIPPWLPPLPLTLLKRNNPYHESVQINWSCLCWSGKNHILIEIPFPFAPDSCWMLASHLKLHI